MESRGRCHRTAGASNIEIVKRALLLSALILGAAAPAVAQAPSRVHVTFGYRYVRANQERPSSSVTDLQGVHGLPLGAEVGATVRLSPKVSLVATVGRSQTLGRTLTMKFGSTQPATTGTATNTLTDVMGGVEISRAVTGPFVALLAGISIPGKTFDGTANQKIFVPSLDQGPERAFAFRPMVGVNIVPKSRRLGARLEAGFDILPRLNPRVSLDPGPVFHFRLAASGSIGIGAPMPAATAPKTSHPWYFGLTGGLAVKPGDERFDASGDKTRMAGSFNVGKRLTPRLALEAAAETETLETVDWKWRYLFGQPYHDDRATHRDTLLLGRLRVLGLCAGNVCVEPFLSGGAVAHHGVDRIVADCGNDLHPKNPCEPVTPVVNQTDLQWGVAGDAGAAVQFALSPRVALAPVAKISYFRHERSLFRDNFRGPDSGSRFAPFFGVSLTIRP